MAGLTTAITVADVRESTDTSFVLEQRTDDPSSPVDGQMWYRTDLD